MTGPFIGPTDHILNASARYSSVTISATVPGAFEIMADPAIAPKKRVTSIDCRLLDNAAGIIKIVNMKTAIR